ncbi:hypothetical protein [Bacillus sp. FDAARGOS_235]|uniref:hypothetical protein n=1 Tax=Bacillus sp. FDAARGOS_235 TaxID=1839798 RepID=UPI0015D09DC5|nr:hypothetical protein [Bacillus sp. FDAARGOS_235]
MIPSQYLTKDEIKKIQNIKKKILNAETTKEIKSYEEQVKLILERALIRYNSGIKIQD